MTTYAWPTSLEPASCTLALVPNVREFASPFTGTYEVVDLIGERWQLSVQMPQMLRATAAAHEAFFNRLRGVHTLSVPYFDRPEPLGTARGSIVLASTAAQGASSLAITAATTFPNLLRSTSFEIDSNADNLADGITLYVGGAGDAGRTYTRSRVPTGSAQHGTKVQFIQITAATNANDSGWLWDYRPPVTPGLTYTLSAYVRTNVSGKVKLLARTFNGSGVALTDNFSATVASAGSLARVSVSFVADATAATVEVHLRGITLVTEYMECDAVQLEAGPAATTYAGYATLKSGDMLGCSGQLFQVAEDVTLDDAGAGTVQLVNRVRTAISASTAVTWMRPTATYRVASGPVRAVHSGGLVQIQDIDLIEHF